MSESADLKESPKGGFKKLGYIYREREHLEKLKSNSIVGSSWAR
jgi:hypothetical protein